MNKPLQVRAMAELTSLSVHTLRYYERVGIMLPVPRDANGHRMYSHDHVRWVRFLLGLRQAGMGISEVRRYAALTRDGSDPDGMSREEMLRTHRESVRARLSELREHLKMIDRKLVRGCTPQTSRDDNGRGGKT